MAGGWKRTVAATKATRQTPRQQASDFMLANDTSDVVSGRAIGEGGKGGFYKLMDGREFRMDLKAMQLLPDGYPKWFGL